VADTFASFAGKVDRLQQDLADDKLSHALGKMAKAEATKAASADLGGDPKFSGWAPTLDTRYDIVGPGRISFHPSRRSAGPWTVAEHGRGTSVGPSLASSSLTPTGRTARRKKKRNNGRTVGKNTATEALALIDRAMPRVVDAELARVVRRIFD
jgi:hypothetical protein